MIKSKLTKTLALGICFTALSSSVVLANGGGVYPPLQPYELKADSGAVHSSQAVEMIRLPIDLDRSISDFNQGSAEINEAMFQKQREVDRYVFRDHAEEIEKMGFIVTHTGPFEDYVEIGITPYSEENAKYLYDVFGEDHIKVVEGRQATTLPMPADAIDIGVIRAEGSEPVPVHENRIIKTDDSISVRVNGQLVQLDVDPFIENDRTLVPLRGVMENLGAEVEWHPEEKAVKVYTEDTTIELVIGEDTAKVIKNLDGKEKEERIKLEVAAQIVNDRTFIPGRFVAEALGAKVDWDNSRRAVIIQSADAVEGKFETIGSYEIKDDKVVFDFELINHSTESMDLQFGSGQQFEITITDEDGEAVYRYSDDKFFTMALVLKNINPGESLKWQDEWDLTNKEGEKLTSGAYQAEIRVMVIQNDWEEKIEKNQLTTIIDFSL